MTILLFCQVTQQQGLPRTTTTCSQQNFVIWSYDYTAAETYPKLVFFTLKKLRVKSVAPRTTLLDYTHHYVNGRWSKQHTSGATTCWCQPGARCRAGWWEWRKGNNTNAVGNGEPRAKFTGNTTVMKGHVFQPRNVSKNANQYHDTVEVLRQYVVKEYETGRELMAVFLVTPMRPTVTKPPDDPTPT